MARQGKLFIVAAPSGAGKTSLVNALVAELEGIQLSISHTTRPQREGEVHGQDYFFVSHSEFNALIKQHNFLEYAVVFNNLYGTSATWVTDKLNKGIDVILEIDWQGAAQVRRIMPQAVSIFILPPSLTALATRLRSRGKDDQSIITQRLLQATAEIAHYDEYDYLLVNDDFMKALHELKIIVECQRLTLSAQKERYGSLLKGLLG